jgi:hypothetical protein
MRMGNHRRRREAPLTRHVAYEVAEVQPTQRVVVTVTMVVLPNGRSNLGLMFMLRGQRCRCVRQDIRQNSQRRQQACCELHCCCRSGVNQALCGEFARVQQCLGWQVQQRSACGTGMLHGSRRLQLRRLGGLLADATAA